jgi:hypothetical protein
MADMPLKFFWLCPSWQFHAIRHDMPDLPPSEVWVELSGQVEIAQPRFFTTDRDPDRLDPRNRPER